MKLTIHLFAAAKEAAGATSLDVDLPDDATVAKLRTSIVDRCPMLNSLSSTLLIAVNNQYANDAHVLQHNDEVACFPPVSGG